VKTGTVRTYDAVDDVVLPAERIKSDGVDVLVEDERKVDGKVHDNETLGTNAERQAVWCYRPELAKNETGVAAGFSNHTHISTV
jgi:hypothetical protein